MTSQRTVSRLSRILALIPYVVAHGSVDVGEIIDRFGYTESQLARDLDTVFVCGLPGYGPGDLMEAYIDDDEVIVDAAAYFARAPRLTSSEAIGLLAAGMAILGSGQGSAELRSAVEKLSNVVVPDAAGTLEVDVAGESEILAELRRAAAERLVVTITYRSLSREEETVRSVEPWAVFSTLGNWYLQAYCRLVEAERNFRVDRIREMVVTEEKFERPASTPAPGVGYTASDDDVAAEILLSDEAGWVPDYYPVDVLDTGPEGTLVRFSSADAEIPARLLLRLGDSARLKKGTEVASRVREIGEELLAIYQ